MKRQIELILYAVIVILLAAADGGRVLGPIGWEGVDHEIR